MKTAAKKAFQVAPCSDEFPAHGERRKSSLQLRRNRQPNSPQIRLDATNWRTAIWKTVLVAMLGFAVGAVMAVGLFVIFSFVFWIAA
jgi:hypothetical protein